MIKVKKGSKHEPRQATWASKGVEMEATEYKLCRFCGQPMKPKGVKKRQDEYDHAQGCPYSRLAQTAPREEAK